MQRRPQPAANEGPDNADDDVADQAKTAAHNLTGQPTGDQADNYDDDNTVGFHHDADSSPAWRRAEHGAMATLSYIQQEKRRLVDGLSELIKRTLRRSLRDVRFGS